MNKDLRGRLKAQWAKLTDDDLDRVDGQAARLLGLLQEKYGYAMRRAEHELLRFLDDSRGLPRRWADGAVARVNGPAYGVNSSSRAWASLKSGVSKPSVNRS